MRTLRSVVMWSAALLLAGCASVPAGPSTMVLPGRGKDFDRFRSDDQVCRDWAAEQTGADPSRAANQSVVSGAALGTLVGAGVGAAVGAAAGDPGTGAAVGAGGGLLVGTAAGANAGERTGDTLQRRYDMSYQQCMYASGNQIPGVAAPRGRRRQPPPPPPPSNPQSYPPASMPPPGMPPPPPGAMGPIS